MIATPHNSVGHTAPGAHQVTLPPDLRQRLEQSSDLVSRVYSCLTQATPILKRNEAFFFPEYTDHGIEHIEAVIHTAWALATPEARKRMTAQDCACLILSVVLHDFAMHLGEQSFVSLVHGEIPHRPVAWFANRFDEKPWEALWNEFLSETSRWDSQRCIDVYGESEPFQMPKLSHLSKHDWSRNERMVAGEFIRRHHGRMAHEFALYGFPTGSRSIAVMLGNAPSFDFDCIADLSGLIARSHSLPLRPSLEYLRCEPHYCGNLRNPYDCHAPFMMVLLRIADYIQIQADRAPAGPVKLVDGLRSPISLREWKTHLGIQQMSREHDDPECIEIVMNPPDVETYLNSRRLIDGLQQELDHSWAVLGEVYQAARQETDRLFPAGLAIRRICSNLDDLQTFARTVSYVPKLAQFRVVAPQMVQLLTKPLYGNRPQIAVRELTQNAVDAVFELRDIRATSPHSIVPNGEPYDLGGCDVRISIEEATDGTRWLVCTDNGRGMTDDVIIDYFLSIGSSFRMSHAWRSAHAGAGGPRFARSGRFGVGVLAAFLLGDEIECTTRSYNSHRGFTFRATPRMTIVELRHVDAPIGTCIRVKLGPHIPQTFVPERWFFGSECKVAIDVVDNEPQGDEPDHEAPPLVASQAASAPMPGWLRLSQNEYEAVDWSPARGGSLLLCNGILITNSQYAALSLEPGTQEHRRRSFWQIVPHRFLKVDAPNLSFVDHSGKLPLRLDRLDLADALPLQEDLAADYVDNILAFWLITFGSHHTDEDEWSLRRSDSFRQFLARSFDTDHSLEILSRTGVRTWETFISRPAFDVLLLREYHLLDSNDRDHDSPGSDDRFLHCHEAYAGQSLQHTAAWISDIVYESGAEVAWPSSRSAWIALGSRWPTDKVLSTLRKFMLKRYRGSEQFGSLNVLCFGPDPIPPVAREMFLERRNLNTSLTRLAVCSLDPTRTPTQAGRLARRWHQLIGDEIPFDHNARQRLIERCRLDPRFERHLNFWESQTTSASTAISW
jgi:molecular chaperone HtpG